MALPDVTIRNAKPGNKQQKLYDGGGLLLVTPTGSRRWILKYRFAGKEKGLALRVYPDVPLADARKRRDEARAKLAANIDPGEAKKPTSAPPVLPPRIRLKRSHSRGWKSAASPSRLTGRVQPSGAIRCAKESRVIPARSHA